MLLTSGCTGLKYIPKEESLYTGSTILINGDVSKSDRKKAESEVKQLIVPKPNTKILGTRPFLWVYLISGPDLKGKGFKHWLKTKVGEPPVYIRLTDPSLVVKAIDARLYNLGYFTSYSQFTPVIKKEGKLTSFKYTVQIDKPYLIQEIIFPHDSELLNLNISQTQKESLIHPESQYNLDMLLMERSRIDYNLKQAGFYYFNPEYILYKMDTALGNGKLRLFLTVKKETPDKAKRVYRFAEVHVFPDFKNGKQDTSNFKIIDSVYYHNTSDYLRPQAVLRALFIRNLEIYNLNNHNLTLNHLSGIGVFKFVNVKINAKDSLNGSWLMTNIFLMPLPQKSLSLEMQGVSKSNNFIGPALTISLRNRNAFHGAELLIYNLHSSFETQLNGIYKGMYTYEIDPRIELYVPRFIVPFRFHENNNFVPHTKFILDYSFLSRVGYFDLNAFKFTFGYKWKQNIAIDHDLSLISVNYYNVSNTSKLFNDLVSSNILLKRRFEEQFIAGMAYSFFYNEQLKKMKTIQNYFNGNVELAGNGLSLYKQIFTGTTPNSENPSKVFGIKFAQFVRMDIDVRNYIHLSQQTMFVSRFIAGWGLPYGNASSMPYVKQFFSGGAYSIRGFRAYSIGPGSYAPADSMKNILFMQQGGEIKLEGNIEYRFPMVSKIKGAFFADAGNVWINKKQKELQGAEFNPSRVFKELAMSIGYGVRLDLSFFVLRLDMAIPVRNPGLPVSQEWVFKQTNFSKIIFNIAFGYPF